MINSFFQISCMCFFIIYKSSLNLILVPYLFYLSVSRVHLSFTDRKICFTSLISIWKTMMKSFMQRFHHPFWWKPCLKLWSRYYQKNVSRETFSFIHYLPSNTADNQQRCDSSTLSILSSVTHTILQMRHQILCTFDRHFLYEHLKLNLFLITSFFCISFSTFLLWMNPIHDIWIIFNCFTWNIVCVCHIPQGKKYGIHVPYSVFYKMFHVKHYSAQLFMATFLYTVEFSRKQ